MDKYIGFGVDDKAEMAFKSLRIRGMSFAVTASL